MKINAPKLPLAYQPVSPQDFSDGELYQAQFSGENLKLSTRALFSACHFKNTTFEFTDGAVSEFTDCLFEKCDLSNLSLAKVGFYRCHFQSSKLLGTDFTEAHFQEVQFTENLLRYANFSGSTLKNARFLENEATETFFTACTFKRVDMLHNQLNAANFWETDLSGIDFSSNHFETLELTPHLAKNIKINLSQAPFFTSLFGIEIV